MAEPSKCFCDLYKDCIKDPDKNVSIGYDAVENREVFREGRDFTTIADMSCPGTTVFIARAALNAENVSVDEKSVTFPRAAVMFQCEYFAATYPMM